MRIASSTKKKQTGCQHEQGLRRLLIRHDVGIKAEKTDQRGNKRVDRRKITPQCEINGYGEGEITQKRCDPQRMPDYDRIVRSKEALLGGHDQGEERWVLDGLDFAGSLSSR